MRSFNMKRKLVDYEVFAQMKENSITTTVKELVEAEEHLARALDLDSLTFSSFNESSVIYEQADGNYLRASYSVDNEKVHFDDIEELVIDEESERLESRKIIRNMLEAVLDDNEVEANAMFEKYMDLARKQYKRHNSDEDVTEATVARIYNTPARTGGRSTPKIAIRHTKNLKKSAAARASWRRTRSKRLSGRHRREAHRDRENLKRRRNKATVYRRLASIDTRPGAYTGERPSRRKSSSPARPVRRKNKMNEWLYLANNVYGFVDFVENGHIITETKVNKSTDGSLSVVMPNSKLRNEGKVLKMQFDNMLKTDVKVLREAARRLVHDHGFCQMVADVKRYNNISDNAELEESISNLVKGYPSVLYLTQEELAQVLSLALDTAGVTNYDDQTCRFMAEGILRVAHDAYTERVDRIKNLANKHDLKESGDKYLDFQKVVSDFFPTLDESTQLEMKMFEDLYNAAIDVRNIALESNNDVVRGEAQDFISELEEVLRGSAMPSLELASDVADWLEDLVEANVPGASETWSVVKTAHKTITGDHPQMAKNAKVPGHPGGHLGDWGDSAPMIGQDSNAWNHGDEARNRSWSNKGGKDTWPSLTNPHVPEPFGDYKMKGEKSLVDDDDGFATWGDNETWPDLQNPYIPKAVLPKQSVQPDNPVE